MDGRIRELHKSILSSSQLSKVRHHITDLIIEEGIDFKGIEDSIKTVKDAWEKEKKDALFSDASLTDAYDLVLTLDELILLDPLAKKERSLFLQDETIDYSAEMEDLISKEKKKYKDELQEKMKYKADDYYQAYYEKIKRLNEKIKEFNEVKNEKKDTLDYLIEQEKKAAEYESIKAKKDALMSESFRWEEKISIPLPRLELNVIFPDLNGTFLAAEEDSRKMAREKKAAIERRNELIDKVKKNLQKYHEKYIEPWRITKAIQLTSRVTGVSSFIKPKGETPQQRMHRILNQSAMSFDVLTYSSEDAKQFEEEVKAYHDRNEAIRNMLHEKFTHAFSEESIREMTGELILFFNNIRDPKKIILIEPQKVVVSLEWEEVLKKYSDQELTEKLKCLQQSRLLDEASSSYSMSAIQKLSDELTKRKEVREKERLLLIEQQKAKERIAVTTNIRVGEVKADSPISPSSFSSSLSSSPPESPPSSSSSDSDDVIRQYQKEREREREEKKAVDEAPPFAFFSMSRKRGRELKGHKKATPSSSHWKRNAGISIIILLMLAGAILTGGMLLGILTIVSWMLYVGAGMFAGGAVSGIGYGLKRCCFPDEEDKKLSLMGNTQIRKGLGVPSVASGRATTLPEEKAQKGQSSGISLPRDGISSPSHFISEGRPSVRVR